MRPLRHKGLGGGLLRLPILRPTTSMALNGLERATRKPRKAVESVGKKGGRGRLERKSHKSEKSENRALFIDRK